MNRNEARQVIQLILYNRYGTFLSLAEVGIMRKAEGRKWAGKVHLNIEGADEPLIIGTVETDPEGNLTHIFSKADLVEKIKNYDSENTSSEDEFGDFFLDMDDEEENLNPYEIREQIDLLLSQGKDESLDKARGLYPLLLEDPNTRGSVLHEMGLLELALENNDLALEYLEAAAREYANRAQIELIFKIADRVEKLLGPEKFEFHVIYSIMQQTVDKMNSIRSLSSIRIFAGLPDEIILQLEKSAKLIKLTHGDVIIKEGDPAINVIIIQSGLLDVVLEDFGKEPKTIRSCFPGEFLGENSVLFEPGTVQATASLISSRSNTTVWKIDGADLIRLMDEFPILSNRIHSIKELHQLDSFFSMHESMQALEVKVRDEILATMSNIMTVNEGDILADDGEVPENIYLIMSGKINYELPSGEKIPFGADHFVCMRDALHGIAVEGNYVAGEESTIVVFDAEKLRNFAVDSPPSVVAVLERLN